jgi:heme-degrading monooxygenase HmoA
MICRSWRGFVRSECASEYIDYVARTGLAAYRETPGNLAAQIWTRDLGDDRTEVVAVSWWESRSHIESFAGHDIDVAVLYPEDEKYLIDGKTEVQHYAVTHDL